MSIPESAAGKTVGLEVDGVRYYVGTLPRLKKMHLIRQEGAKLWPVAPFRSTWDAAAFQRWLEDVAELVDDYCGDCEVDDLP